jgi:hypothetical protein
MRNRSSRSPRWSPRLESLDSRLLLSVTIQANGPQIQVSGDNAADVVSVTDNGQGRVSVTANGRTSTFGGISEIDVQTGGGNDTVNYRLTGSTTVQSRVRIDLGDGNDTANLTANGVRLGADAQVEVDGGSGNDRITANYSVKADGQFQFRLTGGEGNDTVTANLALAAGSTGAVQAEVDGNDGDDLLTLKVTGKAGSLDARLNGNDGFDRGASTPNVRVQNIEAGL